MSHEGSRTYQVAAKHIDRGTRQETSHCLSCFLSHHPCLAQVPKKKKKKKHKKKVTTSAFTLQLHFVCRSHPNLSHFVGMSINVHLAKNAQICTY